MSDLKILVIHDDVKLDNPVIKELEDKYQAKNIQLVSTPNDIESIIKEYIGQKVVIILDYNFNGSSLNGIDILKTIRLQTALFEIILWTANYSSIKKDEFATLVNDLNMQFVHFTSDYTLVLECVSTAINRMETRIDAVIEQWIMNQSEEEQNAPFITNKSGEMMSMKDICRSVRLDHDEGREWSKKILYLAIDLFGRAKRPN